MSGRYVEIVAHLQVQTPYHDCLRGDLMFLRLNHHHAAILGAKRMNDVIHRYLRMEPWCVVSDTRPRGYLPRPCMPTKLFNTSQRAYGKRKGGKTAARKRFKDRIWAAAKVATLPLAEWGAHCTNSDTIAYLYGDIGTPSGQARLGKLAHSRRDCRVGLSSDFDPLSPSIPRELNVIVDTDQVSVEHLEECLILVGRELVTSRGSNAAARFTVSNIETKMPNRPNSQQSLLTLAPSAPQGLQMDPGLSWYNTVVHFTTRAPAMNDCVDHPFISPVLLALAGAVLTPLDAPWTLPFFGQPIDARGKFSTDTQQPIYQGYAPYIPVDLHEPAGHPN
jgi:CRISPR-associated protein Csm4